MKKRAIFCLILAFSFCFFDQTMAISEPQKNAIIEKCDTIKDNLKNIQRLDARARVFLGSHYETILSKFITPLNLRLVENAEPDIELIENQNKFATEKIDFTVNYITYQQDLEELLTINCKNEPDRFYEKLLVVREGRKKMTTDMAKIKELILVNLKLVKNLLESIE